MWSAYELHSSPKPEPTPGLQVVDEVDRKVQERKSLMRLGDPGADLTRIDNPDPNYRYRGVNKRPERIARARAKGFEFVPKEDPAAFQVKMGPDGKEYGDQVLMREPMDLFKHKLQVQKERAEEATRRFREEQKEKINKIAREGGAVGPHQEAAIDESEG